MRTGIDTPAGEYPQGKCHTQIGTIRLGNGGGGDMIAASHQKPTTWLFKSSRLPTVLVVRLVVKDGKTEAISVKLLHGCQ
jgi:hypothetical protein